MMNGLSRLTGKRINDRTRTAVAGIVAVCMLILLAHAVLPQSPMSLFLAKPPDLFELFVSEQELEYLEELYTVPGNNIRTRVPSKGCKTVGGCVGGDRMKSKRHHYGPCYAAYLNKMAPLWEHRSISERVPIRVAEFGILTGSGLAIWSHLFPRGEIYGFDFDLNPTRSNLAFLKAKGSFVRQPNPILNKFDQLEDPDVSKKLVESALHGELLDFVIDDGLHSDESIKKNFLAVVDHMGKDALYVIEDFKCSKGASHCHQEAKEKFGNMVSGWSLQTCDADYRWFALMRH